MPLQESRWQQQDSVCASTGKHSLNPKKRVLQNSASQQGHVRWGREVKGHPKVKTDNNTHTANKHDRRRVVWIELHSYTQNALRSELKDEMNTQSLRWVSKTNKGRIFWYTAAAFFTAGTQLEFNQEWLQYSDLSPLASVWCFLVTLSVASLAAFPLSCKRPALK